MHTHIAGMSKKMTWRHFANSERTTLNAYVYLMRAHHCRDELENDMETLREHGAHRVGKLWRWAVNRNVSSEFEQRGTAVSRLIVALEQRLALGDAAVRKEPDLWSKRSVIYIYIYILCWICGPQRRSLTFVSIHACIYRVHDTHHPL